MYCPTGVKGRRSTLKKSPEIVAGSFEDVVVEPWEEPAYYLRDQSAVTDYLVAFKIPDPGERATLVETPTYVTKSGVNVWARR